jgi:adenylyltransferase/sulfurtransferase
VPNCGEAGVLGALCGVIGSLQAMEAIKLLAGITTGLTGRLLVFDALAMTFRGLNLRKDPDCPLCGEHAAIRAIAPERYAGGCGLPDDEPIAAKQRPTSTVRSSSPKIS